MERRRENSMSPEKEERSPINEKADGRVKKAVTATRCSSWQAPLQSRLRPAMWIPGLNKLHSHKERWSTEGSTPQQNMDSVQKALLKVMETDRTHSAFSISKVESNFLQIHVFTFAEWLDVIEMRFDDNEVKVSAFSTGVLPLILPGACILNLLLFAVPFLDWGMNKRRLKWIVSHMDISVTRSTVCC